MIRVGDFVQFRKKSDTSENPKFLVIELTKSLYGHHRMAILKDLRVTSTTRPSAFGTRYLKRVPS